MPICKNCGVEIEDGQSKCPLCGLAQTNHPAARAEKMTGQDKSPISGTMPQSGPDIRPGSGSAAKPAGGKESFSPPRTGDETRQARVRMLFQEVLGFIALAGAVVVWAVDYAYGMEITWSRYPLAAIAFSWLLFTIPVWLRRRVYMLIFFESLNLALFLFLLDFFTPGTGWFFELALPITAGGAVGLLLAAGSIRIFKLSVLGGITAVLISGGLWILWLELAINQYVYARLFVSWSLIAAASVIPIIAFIVSFNTRLKRQGSNLKKHFHV